MDALSKELDAEIPKAMIDIEVRNNIEQTAQRFAQQGMDIKSTFTPELVKSLAESTRPQAEKNVRCAAPLFFVRTMFHDSTGGIYAFL